MAEGADTDPRRVSIYAVISAETGVDGNHAGKAYHDLVADFPEVHSVGVNFKFPGTVPPGRLPESLSERSYRVGLSKAEKRAKEG